MVRVIQINTLREHWPSLQDQSCRMDLVSGSGGREADSLGGVSVHSLSMFVSQHPVFLWLTNTPFDSHIFSRQVNNFDYVPGQILAGKMPIHLDSSLYSIRIAMLRFFMFILYFNSQKAILPQFLIVYFNILGEGEASCHYLPVLFTSNTHENIITKLLKVCGTQQRFKNTFWQGKKF